MRNSVVRKRGDSPAGRNLVKFIRHFVASILADGEPSVAKAARAAGMSVRTLQRRLLDLGLTYHELLNEVRLEKAMQLLVRSDLTIAGVARALGYSHAAHFSRAFKRWTGEMPSAFRQRMRKACKRRS